MIYQPSQETWDVLKQVGYDASLLEQELDAFNAILKEYPKLAEANDYSFIQYLDIKQLSTAKNVQLNLNKGTAWRPGLSEVKKLEEEGYWLEIVYDLLGCYLFRLERKQEVIVSRFAHFRGFLRQKYPLTGHNINNWQPDHYLKTLISQRLLVNEQDCIRCYPKFKESALKRNVPGRLLPRYFFNMIKHNLALFEHKEWVISTYS